MQTSCFESHQGELFSKELYSFFLFKLLLADHFTLEEKTFALI